MFPFKLLQWRTISLIGFCILFHPLSFATTTTSHSEVALNIKSKVAQALPTPIVSHAASPVTRLNWADLFQNSTFRVSIIFLISIILLPTLLVYRYYARKYFILHSSEFDALTTLMTKLKFTKETKRILEEDPHTSYAILSIDIDNFKYINARRGHMIGDLILKSFVRSLQVSFPTAKLIARDMNDNFLVLMPFEDAHVSLCTKTTCSNCTQCKTKLLPIHADIKHTLSCSKGLYFIDHSLPDVDDMIDCAHLARLTNKKEYGIHVTLFTDTMKTQQMTQSEIVARMVDDLQKEAFHIVLQPKFLIKNEAVVGAEALVRWLPTDHAPYYPDVFIPIFEANGFIVDLDCYVFDKVCRFIHESPVPMPLISVNLSTVTVLQDNIIETYMHILNKYNLSPSQLEIELTESAFTNNIELIYKRVAELRSLGFIISMDDFGSGLSSLTRLQDMSLDIIKLDRGFISDNLPSSKGYLIIKHMIELSKDLNLMTVAEGIETKEQAALLKEMQCDIGQGYYFSRPLFPADFLSFLASHEVLFA